VYVIPRGTVLPKGRKGVSKYILLTASGVQDRFGCYSWAADDEVYYCGSFLDYTHFVSNFEGRIFQYLSKHKRKADNKPLNTNTRVFDYLNEALQIGDVAFQLLQFESVKSMSRSILF
jgi:hypothetical protein